MSVHYTADAAFLYASQNQRLQAILPVVQAVLDGKTKDQIMRERVSPSLSYRTVENIYTKYTKLNRLINKD